MDQKFFFNLTEIKESNSTKNKRLRKTSKKLSLLLNCQTCGLSKNCLFPKMKGYGKGNKKILLIGQAPGKTEDQIGVPFVGPAGQTLSDIFKEIGINIDDDCYRTNVVKCFPGREINGGDVCPSKINIDCCMPFLEEEIKQFQPKLIVCLGQIALQSLINSFSLSIGNVHGMVFPSRKYNCWIGATFHPASFLYNKNDKLFHEIVLKQDLISILQYFNTPLPSILKKEDNIIITDVEQICKLVDSIIDIDIPIAFDYETNSISPYIDNPQILSIAFAASPNTGFCFPISKKENGKYIIPEEQQKMVCSIWKKFLASSTPKIIQNLNMEFFWSCKIFDQEINNFIHDTQVGAHILHPEPETKSLKFQAFKLSGQTYDIPKDKKNNLNEISFEDLSHYNAFDARFTFWAYIDQIEKIQKDTSLKRFYEIYMPITKTLAKMSVSGIKIDVDFLKKEEEKIQKEKEIQINQIYNLKSVKKFIEKENKKFLISSPIQISKIIYEYMQQPVQFLTKGGKPSTDQKVLPEILKTTSSEEVKQFILGILNYRKKEGILKRIQNLIETADFSNIIHPQYSLTIAQTYRSSAFDPNIQNIPKHDQEQKILRKAIIPRNGYIFLECDMSSLEVRIIAMESNDPVLIDQLENKVDFHKLWAIELYKKSNIDFNKCSPEDQKLCRYNAKNGFVFPSFYGSYPKAISKYEAFVEAGISLKHIEDVQEKFWNTYKKVKAWHEDTIKKYNLAGFYEALPGFRRRGPLTLFQLYNNPTQGTGFILFADGLRRIDEEISKRNLKTKMIMEIHDSVCFETIEDEVPIIISIVSNVFKMKRFPWQIIESPIEWEIGNNWANMEPLKFE